MSIDCVTVIFAFRQVSAAWRKHSISSFLHRTVLACVICRCLEFVCAVALKATNANNNAHATIVVTVFFMVLPHFPFPLLIFPVLSLTSFRNSNLNARRDGM